MSTVSEVPQGRDQVVFVYVGYHVYESSLQQVFGIVGALAGLDFDRRPKHAGNMIRKVLHQPHLGHVGFVGGKKNPAGASMGIPSNQGLDVSGGTGPCRKKWNSMSWPS